MDRHGKRRFFNRLITKRTLSDQDRSRLDQYVAEAEKKTGTEIVLSVIDRCDEYPELPWKGFALGASMAGLAVLVTVMLRSVWISGTMLLLSVGAILAAGAVCALLCVLVPGFARIFLTKDRAETEARQYAESLFLTRELFNTRKRTGILLLVGLFERHVIALPDMGLGERLGKTTLNEIIARMTKALASGQIVNAFEEGIRGLEEILSTKTAHASGKNELPNYIIEEDGP